ncbi:uracil phosphoribosyltransferase-domain-containing protein [Flagelloscypha sp. PMI_526]|nr:uracil phosphoribosyltransferase-domain-containing protein [Flagelloscypha sp. PMI_526]
MIIEPTIMTSPQKNTAALTKPTVVGLYGLPGCGKTFLLEQLKTQLGERSFAYFEGSSALSSIVPGGLEAFKQLDDQEKDLIRVRTIHQTAKDSATSGRVGIVTGHLLFWDMKTDTAAAQSVWTNGDAETYTHIFYLDIPADVVAHRRQNDSSRARPTTSVELLEKWQSTERKQLREICLAHGIFFSVVSPDKIPSLLLDVERHTEDYNLSCAEKQLDTIFRDVSAGNVFVFDGDRTLIPEDTGALFSELMLNAGLEIGNEDPVKAVFQSSLGYSYAAFRQVALVYEAINEGKFHEFCQKIADSVTIYPQMILLLEHAAQRGISAVVFTCGLQTIWEKILAKAGYSETVKVVGSGRIENGFVVTGEVKGALVARLQNVHHKCVCAFGDSVLDLPMLKEADRAFVVVGEKKRRSVQMEKALLNAIDNENLYACQVLLPPTAPLRLDTVRLPCVDITSEPFITSILSPVEFASQNAAKLLMTPMRNATIYGPELRKAHARVGQHLANTLLTERIGLEEYSIPHVQGHKTTGYRFRNEGKTSIVALMRGGEPMAQGISKTLPLAMFVHAKVPSDLVKQHVAEQELIILVDSVVNTGKSIVEFVSHIRELDAKIRILVVAGVVQAKAFSRTMLTQIITSDSNIDFVALRPSDNKFTGRGGTDTGHRLFNTTQLD